MDTYGRRKLVASIIVGALIIIGLIVEAMQDKTIRNRAAGCLGMAAAGIAMLIGLWVAFAWAHDHARSELDGWFKSLKSNGGAYCCDGSDATSLDNVDWDSKDGRYRVRIKGAWVDVPDGAIINEPNLDGQTMVWPIWGPNGSVGVRCFIPGSMG